MRESEELKKNIVIAIGFLSLVYFVSVLFYHNIEGWNYLDAAYFVTVTVTTIGYGDLAPRTDVGKIFTMCLAFVGISLAFYLIANMGRYREKTVDKHVSNRLNILRDLIANKRGEVPPELKEKLKHVDDGRK